MWYLLTELYSRKFGVLWFHWFQAWSKDRGVSLIFQARSIPVSTLVWRKRHKVSYFQCSHSRSKRCVVTSTLVRFWLFIRCPCKMSKPTYHGPANKPRTLTPKPFSILWLSRHTLDAIHAINRHLPHPECRWGLVISPAQITSEGVFF